jgi:SAM-dependent methyltransferase
MFLRELLHRMRFTLMYMLRPPWDTGVSPPELLAFLSTALPGRALDLGCGTGTNALTLARHDWDVTAVDFAANAIRRARGKARQANLAVEFIVGDVTELQGIHGTFDLILDIGCYHALTLEGREKYQANLERLLAPGGTYLLYTFLGEEADRVSGITETEVARLQRWLSLDRKEVGTERGIRPSAWFWFERPLREGAPQGQLQGEGNGAGA